MLSALAACSDDEERLPGERLDVRPPSGSSAAEGAPAPAQLTLAPAADNAAWTHANGSASGVGIHAGLPQDLELLWSRDIGSGNTWRLRLSSEPVVAEGRIFTLDSSAGARAFDTDGGLLWEQDLSPGFEGSSEVTGGGIAYGGGTLVATTGFGEVIALDPVTGVERWRHKLEGSVTSAPAVGDGIVVVVSRNDLAVGLSLDNGRIRWIQRGTGESAGVFGGGSPAIAERLVVLPFSSGEVVGALVDDGVGVWSSAVSWGRRGFSRSFVVAITGDPVIDGDTVYVANHSGNLAALDSRTGLVNWSVNEGAYGRVWPAGASVFVVTDESRLKRFAASTGAEVWSVDLPAYEDPEDRSDAYVHYGPVLAGGRLIVAGGDGEIRGFDPVTGEQIGSVEISGGAASRPAIAGGVLYVLSGSGKLNAFR